MLLICVFLWVKTKWPQLGISKSRLSLAEANEKESDVCQSLSISIIQLFKAEFCG